MMKLNFEKSTKTPISQCCRGYRFEFRSLRSQI